MSDEEALELCISAMKNVTYCFNSIESGGYFGFDVVKGTTINEKHPSCLMMLKSVLKKVEGRHDETEQRSVDEGSVGYHS